MKIVSDNITTVYGINNMGCNKSDLCNLITFDIWSWVEKSNIWIKASYIPGTENLDANRESRKKTERSRMDVKQRYFQKNFASFFI